MGGDRETSLKSAVNNLLTGQVSKYANIRDREEVIVVPFNERPYDAAKFDNKNVTQLNQYVQNLRMDGGTAMFDSVSAAMIELAKDKHVLVIGGGDTGNDCVGTSIRLGAKSVTQLEMMPKPPVERAANNPWPEWPRILKTDYGQEEAIAVFGHDPRVYQTTVTEFIADKKGNVCKAKIVKLKSQKDEKTGRMMMVPVEGTEEVIPADVVLIAAGFLGSQKYVTDAFGVSVDARTNVATKEETYETNVPGVFAAGDVRRGQSLVVWAIREGRQCARAIDQFLMGSSELPR